MILLESVAAALVGLAVIVLIISPLIGQQVHLASTVDDPEDLDETPKGIALSALREIEFDRATGKLSDDDYQSLKAKYTAEALVVLRNEAAAAPGASDAEPGAAAAPTADASTADDPVEALVAERLRLLQAGSTRCPSCGPRPEGNALYCSSCGRSLTVGGCAECGAPLLPGSRYCENCGVAVARS
jgi:double zinc ribbon protein